jgi:hypothetical protein
VTPEQRLDRLERIAKLFVRAGLRARSNLRAMDEKINILINSQISSDERFAKHDERMTKLDELMAKSDARFAQFEKRCAEYDPLFADYAKHFAVVDVQLKEQGARTDKTLRILSELVKSRANGN